ncbi:MAG: OmpH family outer membrane protein [Pontiellaceae bacterium]|nr:OmpH family outer membrane protein [Pontiellaceae bacterium]MBN2785353.1 OmpH family outer membrane protein [Pontiellaceae bacterium]
MKSFFPVVMVALFLMAGGVRAADEIAFIDIQEVFKRFYKTQLAQDQIRQQADDIKLERDEMEAEVETLKGKIEELRADSRDENLSEEIRANKRDLLEENLVALQKKEQEMADFEKLRMEQIESQNQRMTKKIFDEIHETVINYAKMKSFAAVVDRSAQSRIGTDVILFAAPKFDITAGVLEVLNEGRKTGLEADTTGLNLEEEE